MDINEKIQNHISSIYEELSKQNAFNYLKVIQNRHSFYDSSERQKRYSFNQIEHFLEWVKINFINVFLSKYGLKIGFIDLIDVNKNSAQVKITIRDPFPEMQNSTPNNLQLVLRKEISNLSDNNYQKMKNCGINIPSLRFVRQTRYIMNDQFQAMQNSHGTYYELKQKLVHYLNSFDNHKAIKNNIINIRLAGDGTNVAKQFSVFNFTFSFIDKLNFKYDADPKTESGNFVLGTFKIKKESYEEIKLCLDEINSELSRLNEIVFKDVTYKISYKLGGDLKFLSLVLGVNAANSQYPCPFCKANKKDFANFQTNYAKRVFGDGLVKYGEGQVKNPILSFVKTDDIIVDVLHLFLRISDRLIDLLFEELNNLDLTYSSDLSDRPNLKQYVDFLDQINIKKPYYIGIKQNIFLRNLNGTEKEKLFDHINLTDFHSLSHNIEKNELWVDFYNILNIAKNQNIVPSLLGEKTGEWLTKFINLYGSSEITPYIHIFGSHFHKQYEYLKKNDIGINTFSMQGLEYMNNSLTRYFHSGTNKKSYPDCDILTQISKKRNRIEMLRHDDNYFE